MISNLCTTNRTYAAKQNIYIIYPPPCFSTFGVSEALHYPCPRSLLSSPFREPPPPPQYLSHLSHQPDGLRFRTLFTTLLLELKFGENGAPGDGRTCNPLTPVHVLERSHFFDKYTKMSGNRPKREPFWDSFLARKSIKNAQNWCLGHPGCRIEGKGAIWDAK